MFTLRCTSHKWSKNCFSASLELSNILFYCLNPQSKSPSFQKAAKIMKARRKEGFGSEVSTEVWHTEKWNLLLRWICADPVRYTRGLHQHFYLCLVSMTPRWVFFCALQTINETEQKFSESRWELELALSLKLLQHKKREDMRGRRL